MINSFSINENVRGHLRQAKIGLIQDDIKKYFQFFPLANEKMRTLVDVLLNLNLDDFSSLNVMDSAIDKAIGFACNANDVLFSCGGELEDIGSYNTLSIIANNGKLIKNQKHNLVNSDNYTTYNIYCNTISRNNCKIKKMLLGNNLSDVTYLLGTSIMDMDNPFGEHDGDKVLFEMMLDDSCYEQKMIVNMKDVIETYEGKVNCLSKPDKKDDNCIPVCKLIDLKRSLYDIYCAVDVDEDGFNDTRNAAVRGFLSDNIIYLVNFIALTSLYISGVYIYYCNNENKENAIVRLFGDISYKE